MKLRLAFVPMALVASFHTSGESKLGAVWGTNPLAVAAAGQETMTTLELAVTIWSVGNGVNAEASR